jgi:hypothetical protein
MIVKRRRRRRRKRREGGGGEEEVVAEERGGGDVRRGTFQPNDDHLIDNKMERNRTRKRGGRKY